MPSTPIGYIRVFDAPGREAVDPRLLNHRNKCRGNGLPAT
jgi:hypothetical protein